MYRASLFCEFFKNNCEWLQGILLTWVLNIVWYFILSSLVYNVIAETHGDLIEYVPEGNSVAAAVMSGWIVGIVVSGLAILARRLIFKFKPALLKKSKENITDGRAEGPEVN